MCLAGHNILEYPTYSLQILKEEGAKSLIKNPSAWPRLSPPELKT